MTRKTKAVAKPETVYGHKAIGEIIGITNDPRKVLYMLAKGQIPGTHKAGRIWVLSVLAYRRAIHGESA